MLQDCLANEKRTLQIVCEGPFRLQKKKCTAFEQCELGTGSIIKKPEDCWLKSLPLLYRHCLANSPSSSILSSGPALTGVFRIRVPLVPLNPTMKAFELCTADGDTFFPLLTILPVATALSGLTEEEEEEEKAGERRYLLFFPSFFLALRLAAAELGLFANKAFDLLFLRLRLGTGRRILSISDSEAS